MMMFSRGSPGQFVGRQALLVTALVAAVAICCAMLGSAAVAQTTSPFPLSIPPGKRYLVDTQGKPFLIVGDSPWSLESRLTRADVVTYLDDRARRGFNTLLFELMDACFTADSTGFNCGTKGLNVYGQIPFQSSGGTVDFTKPVEAYWRHVDFVIAEATKRNFLLLITPAYTSWVGSPEGWYADMNANGSAKLRTFGRFVANRYPNSNIVWVSGGDLNVPDLTLSNSVVTGIKAILPNSMHTHHGSRGSQSIDMAADRPWLDLNAIYTYATVATNHSSQCYAPVPGCGALQALERSTKPFFLIEAVYEGVVRAKTVRSQAYQTVLSGGMGQLMGNDLIWTFTPGWKTALYSYGSRSMTTLKRVLSRLPWHLLVPDTTSTLLPNNRNRNHFPAAVTSDGAFGLVYFQGGTIDVNLGRLAGPHVDAEWIDPLNGTRTVVAGSPFTNAGVVSLTRTGNNANGHPDWLLSLKSVP